MDFDFKPYFKRYEQLSSLADDIFNRVSREFPDCVTCKPLCDDCCHAVFDLTFIEALYINHRFHRSISDPYRQALIEKANRADRESYRLKKAAYKAVASGEATEAQVVERIAMERIRCPMLNDRQLCDIYDFRPITCRLYGIPTTIGGKAHVCGASGFKIGESCPSVNLEVLQNQLLETSRLLAMDLGSRYQLHDILVPLSMAILTDYNEDYLGVKTASADAEFEPGENGNG